MWQEQEALVASCALSRNYEHAEHDGMGTRALLWAGQQTIQVPMPDSNSGGIRRRALLHQIVMHIATSYS